MSKKLLRIGIIIFILTAIAVAVYFYNSKKNNIAAHEIRLFGNVDIRQVSLAFLVSDRVEKVLVQEGSKVAKGQLLAELNTDRLSHEVERAAAQARVSETILARLLAGTRGEDIQKVKAEVAAARDESENAKSTLKRYEALAQTETISKQEVENVRTTAAVAAERLRSAENSLTLAVKGPRNEDINEARAMLAATKAQLATAEKSLSEAKLYAPDNGVIMNRILEPGDLASPQTPVVTLALSDPVWVRAYVVETDLGRIREGMEAKITTDSHPEKTYAGWVGYISPTAEFTPKSVETAELRSQLVYQVRIMVKNPEGELRLGMPATVLIPLSGR